MPFDARHEHGDLAAYLTGGLEPEERERFERHLAGCEDCRAEARELGGTAVLLERAAPPVEVPAGLQERVIGAVESAAAQGGAEATDEGTARPGEAAERLVEPKQHWQPAPWPRRLALGLAGIGALAVALFAGSRIADEDEVIRGVSGPLEIEGALTEPGGEASGDLVVRLLGTGRQVSFETAELPILPTGEYYELWFVGPGDRTAAPNRISAGTFHPDEQGETDVRMHAAVDPTKYPLIEITAEPGDGDPAATGQVVMRLDAQRLIRPASP